MTKPLAVAKPLAFRITVPAGHVALLLTETQSADLASMAMALRLNPRKLVRDEPEAIRAIAADLIVAMAEAQARG